MEGVGVIEESMEGHSELSLEIMACSFASVAGGSRRAREWTLDMEGKERRMSRMCEPWPKFVSVVSLDLIWSGGGEAYDEAGASYNCGGCHFEKVRRVY